MSENYNADQRTLFVFDVFSTFFIDEFYNKKYEEAKIKSTNGKSSSLTAAYRECVARYKLSLEREESNLQVIRDLHTWYGKHKNKTITVSEFIDEFLSKIIPIEYYKDFNDNDKLVTLSKILNDTVNFITDNILISDNLSKLIDNHTNSVLIQIIQDKTMRFLLTKRDEYYQKFAQKIITGNSDDKIKQITNILKEEICKKQNLEIELNRAKNIITALIQKLDEIQILYETTKNEFQQFEKKHKTNKVEDLNLSNFQNETGITINPQREKPKINEYFSQKRNNKVNYDEEDADENSENDQN